MRIEQYFLMTDYSLWEVILNGDSPSPTRIVDGTVQIISPTTAEQRLAKKNELKAIGTLLMALPDKHQLKFSIHKDAKTLMEAINKQFGVISCYLHNGKYVKTLELFGEIRDCAKVMDVERGKEVHDEAVTNGFYSDRFLALVDNLICIRDNTFCCLNLGGQDLFTAMVVVFYMPDNDLAGQFIFAANVWVLPNKVGVKVTNLDLVGVIEDEKLFSDLGDEDAVRVCLLLSLEVIFMGRLLADVIEDSHMCLVENFDEWIVFPWGSTYGGISYSPAPPTDSKYLRSGMRYMLLIMNDFASFVRNFNKYNMGISEIHALLIEYEKGLPKKAATPQVMAIQGGRIQKANKKSQNAKGNGKGKGYPKETMGYSFYYPPENKVHVARNAEFLENSLIDQEASRSLEDLEIIQEDTHPSLNTSLNHEEDDLEIDEPQSDIVPIRRSIRTRHAPDRMCFYIDAEEHELGDLGELANYKAALLDPESEKWLNAMNVEMQSMKDNEVWVIVELLPNGKIIGYTQTPWIDYEETFSPVADIRAIRILIAIAAYYDYKIWKMDVKNTFLNGYLNEEVYMEQPEGFVNLKYPNRVCKLKRSIYGLKQASRQWNIRFDDEIKKFGFTQYHDEPYVYIKASGSNIIFLILYVDDILIMRNSIPMLQSVKTYLEKCFAMKDLGKLKLSKSQGASTRAEMKRMQNVPYASAVGSIMNTKDMFLVYGCDLKRELKVSCYTDAGYLTDADDLKFQTGYVVVPTIEEPISMYCDNTEAIAIANESGITKGARHFCAKVHYLREVIEFGDIKLKKVHIDDNLADSFIKALAFPKHSEHTRNIGMLPDSSLMEPTLEEYMTKTREDYGSRIARPKFDEKARFELKGQFRKELCDNPFSGSDTEDANEHIERVLEIADFFTISYVTQDQLMLRIFSILLTRAARRWNRNESAGLITTWEILKGNFLSKYYPPGRTAKKIEGINNFQQEPNETLY
uniref:Reverse transcriptase Ty1/copia-type domain-containing protein n=1 Tax=Tanacetum cinerariifolium TaxID=118510 RepID=A0A6L2M2I5_TANCI|nr:hypothetical protein [Tanacetum cinerariifolium]